jgi:hypothetical protein
VDVTIIGQRGTTEFHVYAGRGDALGQVDVPLGRVFNLSTGELAGEALPVDSIVARGYWEDVSVADAILADVRERVAALLNTA